MSLSKSEVEKIAHLARLRVSEDDIPAYVRDLSSILELVQQLAEVDTAGIVPMSHPLDATQPLREDGVTESDQRELFQSNAPRVEAGLYLVPKVIE